MMVRHRWGLLYSILSLVILATLLIVWRDFVNPSEEAANQSTQEIPKYTADYQDDEADCYLAGGDGSNAAGIGTCYDVYIKATDEKQFARVASDVVFGGESGSSYVVRVFFYDPGGSSPYATAFYFGVKEEVPPCVTLGREQLDSATVSDGIYVLSGAVGGEGEGTTAMHLDLLEPLSQGAQEDCKGALHSMRPAPIGQDRRQRQEKSRAAMGGGRFRGYPA
jgi:hypothetical protein